MRYLVFSAISGTVWGLVVGAISYDVGPGTVGGMIASPLIGLLMGLATRHWCRLAAALRIGVALLGLYGAAVLFGLAVGVYDWLIVDIPGRIPRAVVLQSVLAYVWGLTLLGWVVFFWPLAYLNHWLLALIPPQDRRRKTVP